jgi:mannose-6-phosphate isomerase-like protein (cupin superfamily)
MAIAAKLPYGVQMTNENSSPGEPIIRAAQIVIPCPDLASLLNLLTTTLGFSIDLVVPADSPTTAVVSGHGVTLRLEQDAGRVRSPPPTLRLYCEGQGAAGVDRWKNDALQIELASMHPAIDVPDGVQQFVLTRLDDAHSWHVGRAGMQYRDLIPGRLGGRFIASHIRIPAGGDVPDYVHFHRIRFQMIYCRAGAARLVYEDQGEPFEFRAGDCVLQPPEIRHRVLETSAGFEVVELGCPAVHETWADHRLKLPTGRALPDRLFGSQHFVRHIAADAGWLRWTQGAQDTGFEARDLGIARATHGLAGARVVRGVRAKAATPSLSHDGEFLFYFVLHGRAVLEGSALGQHALDECDSCVIPAGAEFAWSAGGELEMLEVSLPPYAAAGVAGA